MFKIIIFVLVFWSSVLLYLTPPPVIAASHALLIGIRDYAEAKDLEGPVNDVAALEELLTRTYGFSNENIVTLTDRQATRANILFELSDFSNKTDRGDFIFIYFSGHGTSPWNSSEKKWGDDPFTGGLLPYDYSNTGTLKQCLDRLIIGNRDIRPILTQLDKDRQIFAVFDACYSQYSVRAIASLDNQPPMKISKHEAMRPTKDFADDLMGNAEDEPTKFELSAASAYPYRNTLYISASGKNEKAIDIPLGAINAKVSETVDGKPHGALTNRLLQGLQSGCADTDNNNAVSYGELYAYLKHHVFEEFSHTPQISSPEQDNLMLNAAVFADKRRTPIDKSCRQYQPSSSLKIKLPSRSGSICKKLSSFENIEVVSRNFDIRVGRAENGYVLFLPNGQPILRQPVTDNEQLVKLIARRGLLKDLVNHQYSTSDFNIFADLITPSGVLPEGTDIGFRFRTEADCYLFMVNIDSAGEITVLYPYKTQELGRINAGKELLLNDFGEISGPDFGLEIIKTFAFKKLPATLSKIMGQSFYPNDPVFDEMMQMIRQARQGATAVIHAQTCGLDDLVSN
ncbi:caspase family protein [Desulfobacula toluolica]|uniref:Peptidase C14 domain protein n=1 Tax=Desulfobacula toluolica (strain DSM 7467 / Tol2) TaxID=651182 RepID=K0N9P9_DESTT|nr:caspase family protein [Desulfobacula toluolica]CCK80689.1 peptidase C14 domain protein [Desulfobacula toluolica Tol2]